MRRRPKRSRPGAVTVARTGKNNREATALCSEDDDGRARQRQLSIRTFFSVVGSESEKHRSSQIQWRSKESLSSICNDKIQFSTPEDKTAAVVESSTSSREEEALTDNDSRRRIETVPPLLCFPPYVEESRDPSSDPRIPKSQLKRKRSSPKSYQQLYLDFGQRDFAKRTLCGVCGMLYVHGVDEDIKQHRRICRDFTDGVPFFQHGNGNNTSVRTVARIGQDASICEVRAELSHTLWGLLRRRLTYRFSATQVRSSDSHSLRRKVAQVRAIVDKELGYPRSSHKSDDRLIAYLYISKKRVVGFVSAESISEGYLLESNYDRSTVGRKAVIGIHQIWVHSKFRGRGIATHLVDAVRSKMVYNFEVPSHQIAFSSPTQAGVAFAKSYVRKTSVSSSDQVLVYDCT